MPLHLKRTPAEELERARRRARKATKRKRARELHRKDSEDVLQSGDDADAERNFVEKMWAAMEEDERLDGIDARFNDYYAHVPDRWTRDAHDTMDPRCMDDDEYAEWMRQGMWKRKHAREYEEQAKRDAEKAARRAREKETKAETARLGRLAREREERRAKERRRQREEEHRQQYEQRWKVLLDPRTQDYSPLTLQDIPWPLFPVKWKGSTVHSICVEDITSEALAAFLLLDAGGEAALTKNCDVSRRNRDKLKETLLRFHPDKFEGRFMHRVPSSDMENVRGAVGQVARVLNALMNGQS